MMVKLPDNTNNTLSKLQQITHAGRRGNTVAMSTIGDPCARRLWFNLHWVVEAENISGRLRNLFDTGTRAEDFIIADLERIGIVVTERQEELWGFGKHAHGFTDGRVSNVPEAPKTPHLLEIKTHNDKSFNGVVKDGVKKSKPTHYGQVQRYMIGLKLTRCLYVAYNKNTSAYYVERIRLDKGFAEDLLRKEREIILAEFAPKRHFKRGWFECKFCAYQDICFEGAPVAKNCRTCKFVDLGHEGTWACTFVNPSHDIPREVQVVGCDSYQAMEIDESG